MTFLLFISVSLYCEALPFLSSPLLCSKPCHWSQKVLQHLHYSWQKPGLEGRGDGSAMSFWATINFATLCRSLWDLFNSCAVWFPMCCEVLKRPKNIIIVLSLMRFLRLFLCFCQTSDKMKAAWAEQMITFILLFPLCSYHLLRLSQSLFNTNQLSESVVIDAIECL